MTNNLPEKIRGACAPPSFTLRQALGLLEQNHREIVLVVDEAGRLLGTLTDGDARRAVLKGLGLDHPVAQIMCDSPVVGRPQMSRRECMNLMKKHRILQLPILGAEGAVVDLLLLSEMVQDAQAGAKAVIMAGGNGSRLRPLTNEIPKPLLPVAGKPILELIVDQLLETGINTIFVTTHYKAEQIENHFRAPAFAGVDLRFVREREPLGTAGSLRLIRDQLDGPFLLMNADILTRLSFAELLAAHRARGASVTLAVKEQELQIPYGVVESDGEGGVRRLVEKPLLSFSFNIGIYAISPEALDHLAAEGPFDVTDLIAALLKKGLRVCDYPVNDYWIDIGRLADYEKACEDVLQNRF
jgi:dTDP-glucose pyrophosphorylase